MLLFLHAFSREVAEDTPISSAIKGWTCVFVALSGNYSLNRQEFGKIFSFLVAIACPSVGAISEARRASAFGRSVAYPGPCPLLSGLSFWTRHKTLILIGFPDFRLNRTPKKSGVVRWEGKSCQLRRRHPRACPEDLPTY
ncbi:hypothetical protein GSF67_02695 [Agrobacterium sp. CGMCC 11546]|nr:hypothetical protein GSF67_02695 [Agrobacterium sp. CGMCC 11546]